MGVFVLYSPLPPSTEISDQKLVLTGNKLHWEDIPESLGCSACDGPVTAHPEKVPSGPLTWQAEGQLQACVNVQNGVSQ